MDAYGYMSFIDYGYSDPTILNTLSLYGHPPPPPFIFSSDSSTTISPPKHRHDGTSPLPFGMDWSHPPRKWDGRDSVWPHDFHTGWSYCVTIPSWVVVPKSRGSDSVVFYKVQVGIQSPQGITSIRGIVRRFNEFLKVSSELKKAFPKKNIPPTPPRRLLSLKSKSLLEERRCFLEDWMEKLLFDIDLSRSAPVAIFLELEAAARSSFYDSNLVSSDADSSISSLIPSYQDLPNSDVSLVAGTSSLASDYGNDSAYETSELGTPRHRRDNDSEIGNENTSDQNLASPLEAVNSRVMDMFIDGDKVDKTTSGAVLELGDAKELLSETETCKLGGHGRRLSTESLGSDIRASEISNLAVLNSNSDYSIEIPEGADALKTMDTPATSGLHSSSDLIVAIPSDERHKMNRLLVTMQRRLATTKTDMDDLIARLNQELAVRLYLTTKVKDLEVELETTKQSGKDNLQQAILIERERFTQKQWDTEELRRNCMEMELKLKSEQDEKAHMESTKVSVIRKNEMLLQELDVARDQLEKLQKHHEEFELRSKADVKLLAKEVKSLRSSHSELNQELGRLTNEKLEVEKVLQTEKQRREYANAANANLLHECEILHSRLEECSVNFLIEEEDKLVINTSSPSDAIDQLTMSDNRIGLLLAEAQLLAQDVENSVAVVSDDANGSKARTTDDNLRRMLTEILIDNARTKKQVNSVVRCALNPVDK